MILQMACPIGFVLLVCVLPTVLISNLVTDPDSFFDRNIQPQTYFAPYPNASLAVDEYSASARRRRADNTRLSREYAFLDEREDRFTGLEPLGLDAGMSLSDILFAPSRLKYSCYCKTLAVTGHSEAADAFASFLRDQYTSWRTDYEAQAYASAGAGGGLCARVASTAVNGDLVITQVHLDCLMKYCENVVPIAFELLNQILNASATGTGGLAGSLGSVGCNDEAQPIINTLAPLLGAGTATVPPGTTIKQLFPTICEACDLQERRHWIAAFAEEVFIDANEDWLDCQVETAAHSRTFIRRFPNEEEIVHWISDPEYGRYEPTRSEQSHLDRLCGAVVFENDVRSERVPKYTVRANISAEPLAVEGGRGGAQLGFLQSWLTLDGADFSVDQRDDNPATALWYITSGFLSMQHYVQAFLAQERATGAPPAVAADLLAGEPLFRVSPHGATSFEEFNERLSAVIAEPLLMTIQFAPGVAMIAFYLCRERQSRQREMMRMMGLSDSSLVMSWVILFTAINTVISLASTVLVGGFYVASSNLAILFIIYWLFSFGSLAFGMTAAALITNERMGTVFSAGLFFLSSFFRETLSAFDTIGKKLAVSLLPAPAFQLSFDTFLTLDASGVGCDFDTINRVVTNYTVLAGILMMLADIVLWLLLYCYFDQVVWWHGVGVPRRPWFLFLPSFWRELCGLDAGKSEIQEAFVQDADDADASYFEPETDMTLRQQLEDNRAVMIQSISKQFSNARGTKFLAVDRVSFRMYEGECFCLLGHNGAGKTTTMSMLTGCLPPSRGSIKVCGYTVPEDLRFIRSSMGFCPQQNVLFDELTISEHLWFYGRLSGLAPAKIEEFSNDLLTKVSLMDKKYALASSLSGGMKRKASVAIAFLGSPHLVVLDEPSSGMDPFARRGMWDHLKRSRKGHVLCITTHYMDEADELGDRIGIMSKGRLACLGSSTFLKKRYGCGYKLAFVKKGRKETADGDILNEVRKYCGDDVQTVSAIGRELLLQVPFAAASAFPKLFSALESSLDRLALESYGVSITNLEEVFLKVGHGPGGADFLKAGRGAQDPTPTTLGKEAGGGESPGGQLAGAMKPASFLMQFWGLTLRRFSYGIRDSRTCCMQLLVPNLCILFFILLITSAVVTDLPLKVLNTQEWNVDVSGNKVPIVVGMAQSRGTSAEARMREAWVNEGPPAGVDEVRMPSGLLPAFPVAQGWPESSEIPVQAIWKLAADEELQLAEEKPFVDELVARQALSEASVYGGIFYAGTRKLRKTKRLMGDGGRQLSNYTPVPVENLCMVLTHLGGTVDRDCYWATDAAPAVGVTIFSNVTAFHGAPTLFNIHALAELRCRAAEGISRDIDDIQISNHPFPLSNKQRELVNGLVGTIISLILLISYSFIPAGILAFIVMEKEREVKDLLVISGCSHLAYWLSNYLVDITFGVVACALTMGVFAIFNDDMSQFVEEPGVWGIIVLLFCFCLASTSFSYLMSFRFQRTGTAQVVGLMVNLLLGFVGTTIVTVLRLFEGTKYAANIITWVLRLVPSYALGNGFVQVGFLGQAAKAFNVGAFSGQITGGEYCPPTSEDILDCLYLIGDDIVCLIVVAVVYLVAAVSIDLVVQVPRYRQMAVRKAPPPAAKPNEEDVNVLAEKARVKTLDPQTQIICVNEICKVYKGRVHAVRGVSFAASEGQVFGLLGVNGAGKTTTFKMLCGQYVPSSGAIHIGGHDVATQVHRVRKLIGYCPQFDALLDELTVYEHLALYARLKGVSRSAVRQAVEHQVEDLNLGDFTASRAGQLSGGNKRKLAVAIATTAEPPMVFLDEPSAGMDPVARRFMWTVVQGIADRRKKSVVVLTTHSMEEAEALCSRIAVQVDGRFRCLGSAQQIKSMYGQGLELNVRLTAPTEEEVRAKMGASTAHMANEEAVAEMQLIDERRTAFEQHLVTALLEGRTPDDGGLIRAEVNGTSLRYQLMPSCLEGRFKSLGVLFEVLQETQRKCNLADFQISQTTLEQVFNRFASGQTMAPREEHFPPPQLDHQASPEPEAPPNGQAAEAEDTALRPHVQAL